MSHHLSTTAVPLPPVACIQYPDSERWLFDHYCRALAPCCLCAAPLSVTKTGGADTGYTITVVFDPATSPGLLQLLAVQVRGRGWYRRGDGRLGGNRERAGEDIWGKEGEEGCEGGKAAAAAGSAGEEGGVVEGKWQDG